MQAWAWPSRHVARAIRPAYVLTFPLWKRALNSLLVPKSVIRYFLECTLESKQIDEQMAEYDSLTTHQPGAENGSYAF